MKSWLTRTASLAATLTATLAIAPGALTAGPLAVPAPPPLPDPAPSPGSGSSALFPPEGRRSGTALRINGLAQRAAWLWVGGGDGRPRELWLPLEVLQGQLGLSSRTRPDGTLDLEWFGRGLEVPPGGQRALADEVAVDVAGLLRDTGVVVTASAAGLDLRLPPPRLLQVRSAVQPGLRRFVLDLEAPATVASGDGTLLLGLSSRPEQLAQLSAIGLRGRQGNGGLRLFGAAPRRVFTLGDPARVVIDLPAPSGSPGREPQAPIDPRLQALLGPELQWERQVLQVGGERVRMNAVRLDPRTSSLELRTLTRPEGMQGLSSLTQLARGSDALVAVNGGYFNRVRRLPLGALKDQGRWLSGPILNRGVVAWEPRSLPRFGRLRQEEWLTDRTGRRWPVVVVNSGYVQRGISRYTSDWGPFYRALSGAESALLLRAGVVRFRLDNSQLQRGIMLGSGDTLLVGRGVELPWVPGESLAAASPPGDDLAGASNVMGGGPLLLLGGRIVLNGEAEGFRPAFLRQGAPRTVIGSDGTRIWLITLEGVDQEGPTLAEAAVMLQRLGLRDALNLDGGSSTGLVMGGRHTVKGRGVGSAVHNGLGLVPSRVVSGSGGGGAS
jgi:hypothetical protein